MKHLTVVLSGLSLLIACSGTEEGAAPPAGGATGFAGAGAGGVVSAAGAAGQTGGGAGGTVAGSSGAGGAAAGTAGASTAGSGGVAGATGGAGQGGLGAGGGGAGGASAGGGAGGASAGGGGAGGGGAGGAAQSPEQALYTTNCSACHGATGEGGALGPEIRHPVADFTTWMVRNGSEPRNPNTTYPGPMLPLDTTMVSDAELAMIMTYLNSFPQPTTGPDLYADYCANCHGADGLGAQTTRDITMLADTMAEVPMNVREGHHPGEFELLIEFMPAQDMTVLSDAELMLIATHVESL